MSEYTPDTETVREQYTREQPPHIGTVSEKSAEFDRWLERVKAEAAAEALEEEARSLSREKGPSLADALMIMRLNERAAYVRREAGLSDA